MQAALTILQQSPLARVLDFKCQCDCDAPAAREHTPKFTISFTRRGGFGYHVGRRRYDIHSGLVMLEQPGCEYSVTHRCQIKDECTILEFEQDFFEEAQQVEIGNRLARLFSKNYPFTTLPATSELEYLHTALRYAAQAGFAGARLRIDELLLALLHRLGAATRSERTFETASLLKEWQRDAMDAAKHFIATNFQRELSLPEIARHSHVSVFHFCRLFKQFTAHSPYQYLRAMRLQHAALLLRHTSLPVTQICFAAGFNSFEHFILSFTKQFGRSPSKYRKC
ncbi:MAG: helix-turn-helix transcriptional regulator [candidate division KSB1 bacterium]